MVSRKAEPAPRRGEELDPGDAKRDAFPAVTGSPYEESPDRAGVLTPEPPDGSRAKWSRHQGGARSSIPETRSGMLPRQSLEALAKRARSRGVPNPRASRWIARKVEPAPRRGEELDPGDTKRDASPAVSESLGEEGQIARGS